jgi:hypothetical protein
MRIADQHLLAGVACDSYDGLVRDLSLGELSDCKVPQIVKSQFGELTLDALNLGLAFFIGTLISRRLQLATGGTLNRSG